MKEAHDEESEYREYRIDKCYNRLCFENKSESFGNLPENDTIFLVEKREVSSLHRLEIIDYLFPIDEKYVT